MIGLVEVSITSQKPAVAIWGNVYQHAQTVHFCNYLTAKGGQTAAAAFFVDAVGNVVAVAPGKGDSAHAKLIEHAQGFQTAIDSAAFFDSQQSCCFVVEHVSSIGFSKQEVRRCLSPAVL